MSDSLTIETLDDGHQGGFVIANPSGGEPRWWAELTFLRRDDGAVVITHTGVRSELRGQGVARKLVDHAIADARARGYRIVPVCSYARRVFDELGDAVADVQAV